jgi:hypothetical protein
MILLRAMTIVWCPCEKYGGDRNPTVGRGPAFPRNPAALPIGDLLYANRHGRVRPTTVRPTGFRLILYCCSPRHRHPPFSVPVLAASSTS